MLAWIWKKSDWVVLPLIVWVMLHNPYQRPHLEDPVPVNIGTAIVGVTKQCSQGMCFDNIKPDWSQIEDRRAK